MIVYVVLNRLVRGELGSTVMMLSLLAESIGIFKINLLSSFVSSICS